MNPHPDPSWACLNGITPVAYLDTIGVLLKQPITAAQLAAIRRHADRVTYLPVTNLGARGAGWSWRLLVQRPTPAALQALQAAVPAPDHIINRIDVALDVPAADQREADEVRAFILAHLVQRHRGKRQVRQFKATTYWGQGGTARNLAVYASRPSKITGMPCVHIESRTIGAASCRRLRLATAGDLVLAIGNLRRFCSRVLVLEFVCPRLLAKRIGQRAVEERRRKFPTRRRFVFKGPRLGDRAYVHHRAATAFLGLVYRHIAGDIPDDLAAVAAAVSVQGFKDDPLVKKFLPRVTRQIDGSIFLP